MKNIFQHIKQQLSSRMGRNTLTFLVFLAISTLFWLLTSLNDEIQKDYELGIEIDRLPKDMTLLSNQGTLPKVTVSVRDKGISLLSKQLLGTSTLHIDYRDFYDNDNGRLSLTESQLNSNIRQIFGSTSTITNLSPDSLSISYTTLPPIKVPLIVKTRITPKPQFILSGQVIPSTDSVLVYMSPDFDSEMSALSTEIISMSNINDTTTVTAQIIKPAGCRTVPSEIKVTIPVEPLVTKSFDIPVEAVNLPEGLNIVTFPSTVKFNCLVPMSIYNSASYPVKAYADYAKRQDNIIPLELSILPDNYHSGTISPQNVEYVLEQNDN